MAKENPAQEVNEQLIHLNAFLGTKSLTRAEKKWYERTFGQDKDKQLSITEWSKLTGLA